MRESQTAAFAIVVFGVTLLMILVAMLLYYATDNYQWFVLPTASGLILIVALVLLYNDVKAGSYIADEFNSIKSINGEQRRIINQQQQELNKLRRAVEDCNAQESPEVVYATSYLDG